MEGAAQTLVSNVGQLVGAEFRQLRGVGGEVARLRNQLSTINALLRMQSEADEDAVDHFIREWMKQLREVGYDAEDCVDLYLFRVRSRPGDHLFVWCKRLLTTLWSRHRLASDIRDLRAHATDINEQHASYGISLEALRRPLAAASAGHHVRAPPLGALRPADGQADTAGRPEVDHLVGNKARATVFANKVKDLKKNNRSDDPLKLKVFSIVGFGGLGKTTLAVEVCRQLETEFQSQALVSVSQTFSANDLQGLLKSVLRQIAKPKKTSENQVQADTLVDIDTKTVEQLKEEVRKRLDNQRYLILIDDVWSISAWDAIRSKLPDSNCGSRIIVTTRIETVARACSVANDIHHMKKLDDEESKKLFLSKAFPHGGTCPADLDVAMASILKKCGGLPLAIVSIASLLASYKFPEGKEMWEIVQKSIGSQMESNPTLEGMREILTLSYTHLPHHLKACMLYLSIFPEDYSIAKDRLMKRWIAEGLIAEKRGLTKMDVAEGYFNELMSKSMLDWADSNEETCRVHDMMLEILVSKSLEANFVSLVGGQYEGMSYTNTIRRLSIHGGAQAEAHNKISSPKSMVVVRHGMQNNIKGIMMEHVRSLSIFDPEADKVLARLGEFTLLRVLDLEDCKGLGEKHMRYICRMYLLRFLSLKGTDIKEMPSIVGDLEHLQTLDVRETCLKSLPKTVTRLEKLEHLLFSNKEDSGLCLMLPRGIKKMKALRQLNKAAVTHDPEVANEIGDLYQLQEVAIYVDTRVEAKMDQEKVSVELACSLSKLYSLRWLDITNLGGHKWIYNLGGHQGHNGFVPIMDFLYKVEPEPRLLRYLKICGRLSRGLPAWVGSLNHLVEMDLIYTYLYGPELFHVLCKLPRLKRLTLGAYFCSDEEEMVFGSNEYMFFEGNDEHMVFEGSNEDLVSEGNSEDMVSEGNNEDMVSEGNNEDMVSEKNNEDMVAQETKSLKELKELTLGYAYGGVPGKYKFLEGSMPKLEKLVVILWDQWKKVIGIENLKNLKEVQYTGYRENIEEAVNSLKQLITEGKVSETVNFKVRYLDDDKA